MKTFLIRFWRRLALIVMAFALLGALAFVALQTGPLAPVKVQVVKPRQGQVHPEIFGIGQIEARRHWSVGPVSAGRVLAMAVDVGQTVRRGDVLLEMDPVDMEQRIRALDSSLGRAESAHAASVAQLKDAKARLALASASLRRNQDLATQHFISAGALDAKEQEMTSAEAGLQAAHANVLASLQDQSRVRAERDALLSQRSKLRLEAPADGVVAVRDAEVGSAVMAGQPVVQLYDPASVWVRMRVDQGRAMGLQAGLKAIVLLRSHPDRPIEGKLERVEPLADSVTEERLAMVTLDTVPDGLSIGEMAEITLALPASAEGWVLPNATLHQRNAVTGVWRVNAGPSDKTTTDKAALHFVDVKVLAQGQDGMVVVAPVKEGQLTESSQVVVYSQKAIEEYTRIRVVEQLAPTGALK